MANPSITALRKTLLNTLPPSTIDEFAAAFYFPGNTTQEKIDRIARSPGNLVSHLLGFDVPAAHLKRAASALGINLRGLRARDDIADHLALVFRDWEQAVRNGQPLSTVVTTPGGNQGPSQAHETLWKESERIAQPVLYLKARKSSQTTRSPIACWNVTNAARKQEGLWLRVDLRRHPNARLTAHGVLRVEVQPGTGKGQATLDRGKALLVNRGEKPLYAEDAWDFPCREILETKGRRPARDLLTGDRKAAEEYEAEWAKVNPTDNLTGSQVYAQLGGWPVTWPEEGADEQLTKQLVLRTYRDAEPWIEVFRTGRRYAVCVRIT